VYGKTIINTPENAIGNVDLDFNPSEPSASRQEQPVRHPQFLLRLNDFVAGHWAPFLYQGG
jgi:hypothetical protein